MCVCVEVTVAILFLQTRAHSDEVSGNQVPTSLH